ncbi:sulfite oxidase heme-binding subunit YedZ [Avibacterium paragallinarum]|uniref:sulfite oxidase heme-binding subunit YedZ n=1 Tax=Avibacterium paragallinarum TaxID=728 RepID=UPI00021ACCA7|nr:ferric reductase-like transmembrane domain-containing protein [Avibacterium paragallinarum]
MKMLRFAVHFGAFCPFLWLIYEIRINNGAYFGADPVKEMIHFLGWLSLSFFLVLFIFRLITQWTNANSLRWLHQPLGLWAITWAFLHILAYLYLELGFDVGLFFNELATRPYLLFGASAFFLFCLAAGVMIPAIRQQLRKKTLLIHQVSYFALVFAAIHYYWSTKSYDLNAVIYLLLSILIFGYWKYQKHH